MGCAQDTLYAARHDPNSFRNNQVGIRLGVADGTGSTVLDDGVVVVVVALVGDGDEC